MLILLYQIFGICGIISCTLKLKHGSEEAREDFFKLSIVFATCNLVLSVLLLVSVIKVGKQNKGLLKLIVFVSE